MIRRYDWIWSKFKSDPISGNEVNVFFWQIFHIQDSRALIVIWEFIAIQKKNQIHSIFKLSQFS